MGTKRSLAHTSSAKINLIMEDLLTFLVTQITDNPPQKIESKTENEVEIWTITVPKEKMAILIGKNGRVISAIRTLARIKGAGDNTKVNVELQEG